MKLSIIALLTGIVISLTSCSREFQPIDYGKEACAHCKMTIVDDRFAAELVDEKGKAFKFDDVTCMKQFMTEQNKSGNNLLFVEDYFKKQPGAIDASKAIFLTHEFFASPMNGDYAAFESETDAKKLKDSLGLSYVRWEEIK